MALRLVNTEDTINFYIDLSDDSIYWVPKDYGLIDIRKVGENKCSDWVLHILGKTWCDNTKVLYELAQIIQEVHPENEIDWKSTFYIVEKSDYVGHVKGLKKPDNYWASIIIGQTESTPEVHDAIEKIVSQNLGDYGLI